MLLGRGSQVGDAPVCLITAKQSCLALFSHLPLMQTPSSYDLILTPTRPVHTPASRKVSLKSMVCSVSSMFLYSAASAGV